MFANLLLATTGDGVARATRDGSGRWSVEHVLGGHDVRCLAGGPLDPGLVYAGAQGGGVLRSRDGGQTWQSAGLANTIVKALALSPLEPQTVYAGTKSPPRLLVSRDGGEHWSELGAFRKIRSRLFWFSPAEKPFTAYVQGIALSPTDPQVIVVGIEAGAVVRSADGGQTWQDHRPGALRDCHSLAFHATDGRCVYEGGGTGAGAAFSADGGATWTQPGQGLDRRYGWACAADPADPETWYVSLSPGAFKAHSESDAQAYIFRRRGAAWEKLGGGLPQPLDHMPYALITRRDAPGEVYAGLSNGDIWHSGDRGETWERLPVSLGRVQRAMIAH